MKLPVPNARSPTSTTAYEVPQTDTWLTYVIPSTDLVVYSKGCSIARNLAKRLQKLAPMHLEQQQLIDARLEPKAGYDKCAIW